MKADELWRLALAEGAVSGTKYEAWAFGGEADELARLTAERIKTATASAYPLYELEGEPLPVADGYNVILNEAGEAVCITQTTRIYVIPFDQVSEEHAFKEGEGDRSLENWRKTHRTFFAACLAGVGTAFTEEMPVVCEEFEVVFPRGNLE